MSFVTNLGILHYDRINNNSPYKYNNEEILATNPCLVEGTVLLDKDRLVKIEEEGNTFKSWKTGDRKTITLVTDKGFEITLTHDHPVMLDNGEFIPASETLGKEIKWEVGDASITDGDRDYLIQGLLFGRGQLKGNKVIVDLVSYRDRKLLYPLLRDYGFKIDDKWLNATIDLDEISYKLESDLGFLSQKFLDRTIPNYIFFNESNKVGTFLIGLYEARGKITKKSVVVSTFNRETNKQIQLLLSLFGIKSYLDENSVRIFKSYIGIFKEKLGFYTHKKHGQLSNKERVPYPIPLKVEKILVDKVSPVYDFQMKEGNPWNICNGITCHNCAEQPLPPGGICTLASIDVSKLVEDKEIDLEKLETLTRIGVRLLDDVLTKSGFPTEEIKQWAEEHRSIGLGIMGFADMLLKMEIEYGSDLSLEILEFVLNFMYKIAEDESITLGEERGIPKACKNLPKPRRNFTLLTQAPTGSISLLAGCSSGIEPVFSELTIRTDKTGTYELRHDLADKPYFKCAVSANGGKEVTWEEHLKILNSAQKFVDSGVSKTINCPKGTKKETVNKIYLKAFTDYPYIKGLTIYRNGSREEEVLTPKNLQKNLCPQCGSEMKKSGGCTKCTNPECQFSYCETIVVNSELEFSL